MAKKKPKKKDNGLQMGTQASQDSEALRIWMSRIGRGENKRDHFIEDIGGLDFKAAFEGQLTRLAGDLAFDSDIRIPSVNLLWAIVKTEIPALNIKNPHFEVNARKNSSILAAKIQEKALNYVWKHKRMKREIDKVLQDVELIGHSWFKSGFTGKFGAIEEGNGYVQEYVESQDFFGYYVSWKDVVMNAEAFDPPHDCRWIAHRFFRPLEDVQKNERYGQSARDKLIGSPLEDRISNRRGTDPRDQLVNFTEDAEDSFTKWVKLYEVHDIVKDEIFTISEGVDEYLESPKKFPLKLRGSQFSFLGFNPINDQSYPIPEAAMYIDQIINHVKIRFQQLDHLKRGNRQYTMPKAHLDEEKKKNLSLGLTGAIHEHNGEQNKIELIGSPAVPVDSYTIEQRNLDDLVNVSGQSPFERGASGRTSTRTIGEIFEQQRGSKNRRSDKVDKLHIFFKDIGRNLMSLIMQFATKPFYVQLEGPQSEEFLEQLQGRPSAISDPDNAVTNERGFTMTTEDIQGEFDIDLEPGSAIVLDREAKLEILPKIAELVPPLVAAGGPVAAAVGKMFAEELDWPELQVAIEEEIKLTLERQKKQAEAAEEQRQIQAAQFGVENQLEAEKIQSKNTGDQIKFATTVVNASGGKNGKETSN